MVDNNVRVPRHIPTTTTQQTQQTQQPTPAAATTPPARVGHTTVVEEVTAPRTTVTQASKEGAAAIHANNIHANSIQANLANRPAPLSTTTVNVNAGSAADQEAARRALIAQVPQTNPVAVKAGNSLSVCGGASVANAMILTDKGGNNARALEKLAQDANVSISPREQQALNNWKGGNLSPDDVAHIQQLTWRTGAKGETGAEPARRISAEGLEVAAGEKGIALSSADRRALDALRTNEAGMTDAQKSQIESLVSRTGILPNGMISNQGPPHQMTAGGMGGMVAALKARGAFANGENVTFQNSTLNGPQGPFNHWTVNVGNTHMNSMPAAAGGGAQVSTSGVPSGISTGPKSGNFVGQVTLTQDPRPPRIDVDTPNGNNSGTTYTRIRAQPGSDDAAGWNGAFTGIKRATQNRPTDGTGVTFNASEPKDPPAAPPPDPSRAPSRTAIDGIMKQKVTDSGIDNDIRDALKANPNLFAHATPSERLHMMLALRDGWTSSDDKAAMQKILDSAQTPEERSSLRAAGGDYVS